MVLETGNPQGALIYFVFLCTIGVVLGSVLFSVFAFRGARRTQFRQWGTMPRTGAVAGLLVAGLIIYVAWSQMYRGFYVLEIDDKTARLGYRMPAQWAEVPVDEITAMEKRVTFDKGGNHRLVVETTQGTYTSAPMYRRQFNAVWESLAPYRGGS